MKKLVFGIVMLFGALLTGCAPSQLGTGQSNPIPVSDARIADVPTGGVWYIKVPGPVGLIDLRTRNNDLRSLYQLQGDVRVGVSKSASVIWFSQTDVRAPEDWGVELVSQTGVREIRDVESDGSYSYSDRLELTFAVRIPADAAQGPHFIQASLISRGDGTKTANVPFAVNIGIPSNGSASSN
jgi:hypothetical protein